MSQTGHQANYSTNAWERVRAEVFSSVLEKHANTDSSIVDYACDDAYLTSVLAEKLHTRRVIGIDLSLTPERQAQRQSQFPNLSFVSDQRNLNGEPFDILTLFGALEHFSDDAATLRQLVYDPALLKPEALVMVSVPAYPQLYGHHDVSLRHYRRYTRKSLKEVLTNASLKIIDEGTLFHSLIVPRVVMNALSPLDINAYSNATYGNQWSATPKIDKALEVLWSLEASIFSKIPVDGLTIWALCRKIAPT